MLSLIGEDLLRAKIKECIFLENYQMALQLNWFLQDDQLEKIALKGRATQVANANARHYFLARANGSTTSHNVYYVLNNIYYLHRIKVIRSFNF